MGTEDSCKLMWRRGGLVRLVIARVKYRVSEIADDTTPAIATTEMPGELVTRSIAALSLLAHVVTDKLCDGLPLHRQEDRFARLGTRIDRGTMSRWIEDLGMTVGATVVKAMHDDAFARAFCIATDATGVLVQPIPGGDQVRRACRRGHYFVQIADADHVFFEYTPKETSAVVGDMFRGFSGYIQADAKSVYDLLFRPPEQRPVPDDDDPDVAIRQEVGCWAHARRKFWEAAIVDGGVDPTRLDPSRSDVVFEFRRRLRAELTTSSSSFDVVFEPSDDAVFEEQPIAGRVVDVVFELGGRQRRRPRPARGQVRRGDAWGAGALGRRGREARE